MTGRNTPSPDSVLHLLDESDVRHDPALVGAVRDIAALGEGPAPEASTELAQLMADGGRASRSRRTKSRITFIGGTLAVSMGIGMSGVAAETVHLQGGFESAVDSLTRFAARDSADRAGNPSGPVAGGAPSAVATPEPNVPPAGVRPDDRPAQHEDPSAAVPPDSAAGRLPVAPAAPLGPASPSPTADASSGAGQGGIALPLGMPAPAGAPTGQAPAAGTASSTAAAAAPPEVAAAGPARGGIALGSADVRRVTIHVGVPGGAAPSVRTHEISTNGNIETQVDVDSNSGEDATPQIRTTFGMLEDPQVYLSHAGDDSGLQILRRSSVLEQPDSIALLSSPEPEWFAMFVEDPLETPVDEALFTAPPVDLEPEPEPEVKEAEPEAKEAEPEAEEADLASAGQTEDSTADQSAVSEEPVNIQLSSEGEAHPRIEPEASSPE